MFDQLDSMMFRPKMQAAEVAKQRMGRFSVALFTLVVFSMAACLSAPTPTTEPTPTPVPTPTPTTEPTATPLPPTPTPTTEPTATPLPPTPTPTTEPTPTPIPTPTPTTEPTPTPIPTPVPPFTDEQVARAKAAVFHVRCILPHVEYHSVGTVIEHDGKAFIATTYHGVDCYGTVRIVGRFNGALHVSDASMIGWSDQHDVAILAIDEELAEVAIPLSTSEGGPIHWFAYRAAGPVHWLDVERVTTGRYSYEDPYRTYDIKGWPGDSGSAIIDNEGRLRAIVTSKIRGYPPYAFATASTIVRDLMDEHLAE